MPNNSNQTLKELPQILTVPDIAKYLRISRSLAYELAHHKDFPSIVINRTIRISKDAFLEWINEQKAGKPDNAGEYSYIPGRGVERRM
ncbi:helix-turn-helix domain-containing protein [Phosphitispora fastidiosa]|uniref:helix-turn-helix domain-containing protein n=1 Tax=Phosphitispora fastidiosa TaxID=2837202 RepID=UPI001E5E82BC|nr:helix-turn-helix domain-containing protein [Phosphitispora fastidiosa]MBU7006196.1 excisionase family DNA binding protein [Phosphitispora fastidiosa]